MDDERSLHVVVFPWLAFGHMLPFLEVSKSLAKRGHHISFISTPRNIQRLPKLPSHLSQLIDFISLPLPPTQGLPENAESTSDLLPDDVQYLKKAFDSLRQPFTQFISEVSPKPDWIIQDFAQHWAPHIGAKFGVPCIFFSMYLAATLSFLGPVNEFRIGGPEWTIEDFTAPPKWRNFPSSVAYRRHEAKTMVGSANQSNASGVLDFDRMQLTIQRCNAVALRSCMEFESDWICLLGKLYEKPVVPVGLLPPPVEAERGRDDGNMSGGQEIFHWLDQQAPKSVVYIAFGSEATLSTELMHELALGLELSKIPFLWALRKPQSMREDVEILPEGFVERTKHAGIVATGWIPQLKVLAHASIGAFLTHCGWSSVIESFQFGHPLILLPIFVDQGVIARLIGERGISVEVERNEEDGSFTKETVAESLRLVMVEEEGQILRAEAVKVREIFSDQRCHEKYVDDFVKYLKGL